MQTAGLPMPQVVIGMGRLLWAHQLAEAEGCAIGQAAENSGDKFHAARGAMRVNLYGMQPSPLEPAPADAKAHWLAAQLGQILRDRLVLVSASQLLHEHVRQRQ